ncbi:hypothetical protein BH10PSE15_BH10PSE15_01460 [soil metagenome]
MKIITFAPDNDRQLSGTAYAVARALNALSSEAISTVNVKLAPYGDFKLSKVAYICRNMSLAARHGFALSPDYLSAAYASAAKPNMDPTDWFLCFQPLAPAQVSALASRGACKIATYIDFSLNEYLSTYSTNFKIPLSIKSKLLSQERKAMHLYNKIFVFDEISRASIIKEFDLDSHKVAAVGRGVNLSALEASAIAKHRQKKDATDSIQLLFIGKDAKRKGLYEIVTAMDRFNENYTGRVHLHVVGPEMAEIPVRDYITAHGLLDRVADQVKFQQLLGTADFGVMLSEAEGGVPSGILEYLASGIPAIVTDLPRIKYFLGQNSTIFVDVNNRSESFSDVLNNLVADGYYLNKIHLAKTEMNNFRWSTVVENMISEFY